MRTRFTRQTPTAPAIAGTVTSRPRRAQPRARPACAEAREAGTPWTDAACEDAAPDTRPSTTSCTRARTTTCTGAPTTTTCTGARTTTTCTGAWLTSRRRPARASAQVCCHSPGRRRRRPKWVRSVGRARRPKRVRSVGRARPTPPRRRRPARAGAQVCCRSPGCRSCRTRGRAATPTHLRTKVARTPAGDSWRTRRTRTPSAARTHQS